jgi:hypothetical protein
MTGQVIVGLGGRTGSVRREQSQFKVEQLRPVITTAVKDCFILSVTRSNLASKTTVK